MRKSRLLQRADVVILVVFVLLIRTLDILHFLAMSITLLPV